MHHFGKLRYKATWCKHNWGHWSTEKITMISWSFYKNPFSNTYSWPDHFETRDFRHLQLIVWAHENFFFKRALEVWKFWWNSKSLLITYNNAMNQQNLKSKSCLELDFLAKFKFSVGLVWYGFWYISYVNSTFYIHKVWYWKGHFVGTLSLVWYGLVWCQLNITFFDTLKNWTFWHTLTPKMLKIVMPQ